MNVIFDDGNLILEQDEQGRLYETTKWQPFGGDRMIACLDLDKEVTQ